MNKISIGILSYKRTDLLLETIKDILETSYEIDLIILNNNEDLDIKSDICNLLNSYNNINLKYLWYYKNLGVATGRREILFSCETDFIIMLDDDIIIPSIDTIISNVFNEFNNDNELGGIAFNIVDLNTSEPNPYEIPHKNKKINLKERFYTYLMIGAGHALRASVAVNVGNYPDDFGLYGFEEIDLAFRIINKGNKIIYNPNCQVIHKKSPDGRFSGMLVNYQAFVNRTKMSKRYLKTRYFISCFLVRSFYFLYKTKDVKNYVEGVKEIYKDNAKNKFSADFYRYLRSVNGFIYY